jgi:Na+/proline symporter
MSPVLLLGLIAAYFLLLSGVAWATVKHQRTDAALSDFFRASGQAPWYLVAFGMIGTSLSGVTFISVPGAVGIDHFAYLQIVLGYVLGYVLIASVLLPVYYRLELNSIYGFLGQRFDLTAQRVGSFYFLLSRSLGSAARLYLAVVVLQGLVFDALGVPFALTVALTLGFIMLYTSRGGIRTIVWTDTLQTLLLLGAAIVAVWQIGAALGLNTPAAVWNAVAQSPYSQAFHWDWSLPNHFAKQFLAGALIALVMTGLDQDMMQKNLACHSLRDAQKNVLSLGLVLVAVNLLFLALGALLYAYQDALGLPQPTRADLLFPSLATQHLGPAVAVLFVLGLVAAAYSSADGSLAALTTAICVDFFQIENRSTEAQLRLKRRVHWAVALGFFLLLLGFQALRQVEWGQRSVIQIVLMLAGYTYGPLLGLFVFGLLSRRKAGGWPIVAVCLAAPLLCLWLDLNIQTVLDSLYGIGNAQYKFGYELLAINGLLTACGLWMVSKPVPTH